MPVTKTGPEADPFHEFGGSAVRRRFVLLGGLFEFESSSRRFLRLVDVAYAGLPAHRLHRATPRFRVRLELGPGQDPWLQDEPPSMQMRAGAGLLCGVIDASNFATLSPSDRRGLVVASPGLLRFPYHARYELLEFAVFVLAGRAQGLVPLHAACIGLNGRCLLLIGASGAGKSTLALQCLLRDMEFLTEDSTFVLPEAMLATGVSNFLHIREDAVRFFDGTASASRIRRSAIIRRRSGVEKFEIDVRRMKCRLASGPPSVAGVVFLSPRTAVTRAVLRTLDRSDMLARLDRSQRYAANQPGWKIFRQRLSRLSAFELLRGRHPEEAAVALLKVLQ